MPKSLSHSHSNGSNKKLTEAKLNGCLPKVLTSQAIGIYARKSQFKKRESDFDFVSFFKAMVLTTGNSSNTFSITKSCKCYNSLTSDANHIEDKPFYNRVRKEECLNFISMCYKSALSKIGDTICPRDGAHLLKTLRAYGLDIDDIEAYDGSYWHVHDELADLFPGTRTAAKAKVEEDTYDENGNPVTKEPTNAQIDFQCCFSIVKKNIVKVDITSGTASEREYVNIDAEHPTLKLADAGYVNYAMFNAIDKSGSYYIVRGKKNIGGSIVSCIEDGEEQSEFIGKKVSELRSYKSHKSLDLLVRLKVVPNSKETFVCRIIRVYSKRSKDPVYFMTNINRKIMDGRKIAAVYRCRWQIEQFFKLLKSGCNLRGVRTKFVSIILVYLMSSLIASMVKQLVFSILAQFINASAFKIFTNAEFWFKTVLVALMTGDETKLKNTLKQMMTNEYTMCRQASIKIMCLKTFRAVIEYLDKSLMRQGVAKYSLPC